MFIYKHLQLIISINPFQKDISNNVTIYGVIYLYKTMLNLFNYQHLSRSDEKDSEGSLMNNTDNKSSPIKNSRKILRTGKRRKEIGENKKGINIFYLSSRSAENSKFRPYRCSIPFFNIIIQYKIDKVN